MVADSLDITVVYLDRLPKNLQATLARGSREGRQHKPVTPEQREAIAREVLASGVGANGPALEYMVLRIRAGFGVGRRPVPPMLPAGEIAFIEAKIDDIVRRLGVRGRS